jgi:phage internal scaffolding protein
MTKKKTEFVTAYGDRVKEPFFTEGESLTQQHMAQECDIKEIIKRHDRTGIIEHVNRGVAAYGDYSEVHEYREALDLINNAKESFMVLPSDVRKMFDNDPGEFFEFATDPANAEKMVELGLAPSPDSAPPTNEESAAEGEDAEKSEA